MAKKGRAKVKRNFREVKSPVLFVNVQNVITQMTLFILVFANPKVPLDKLQNQLTKVILLYNIHLHGDMADTANFLKELEDLILMLYDQADYVDQEANGDLAIVLQSGFSATVSGRTSHKNDETYTQGKSGEVDLVLKARNGASGYCFEYCVYDPSGVEVWIMANCTKKAKFTYTGLTPLTVYLFRYAPIINDRLDVWSNPYRMGVV